MIHAPSNRTHFKTQEHCRFLYVDENGKHASRKFFMQSTPAQIEVAISTVYDALLIY